MKWEIHSRLNISKKYFYLSMLQCKTHLKNENRFPIHENECKFGTLHNMRWFTRNCYNDNFLNNIKYALEALEEIIKIKNQLLKISTHDISPAFIRIQELLFLKTFLTSPPRNITHDYVVDKIYNLNWCFSLLYQSQSSDHQLTRLQESSVKKLLRRRFCILSLNPWLSFIAYLI